MSRHIKKGKRFAVLTRDNHTCQYCGKSAPGVRLEIDHKLPYSKGGDNSMENLITSCFDCNRGKGSKELKAKNPQLSMMEYKQKILERVAWLQFDEQGEPVNMGLLKTMLADFVLLFGLDTSEVLQIISCSRDMQHLSIKHVEHLHDYAGLGGE